MNIPDDHMSVPLDHFDLYIVQSRMGSASDYVGGFAYGVLNRDGREYWSGLYPLKKDVVDDCLIIRNSPACRASAQARMDAVLPHIAGMVRTGITQRVDGRDVLEPRSLSEAKEGWPIYPVRRFIYEFCD